MAKSNVSTQNPPFSIIEDSILAGIVEAFNLCKVIPQSSHGRTVYRIEGPVDEVLEKIYRNEPVGALDALKSIKSARQAIFTMKDRV